MSEYGKKNYWDERYKNEKEPFDWYHKYAKVKDLLGSFIKTGDRILVIGCGNSDLSDGLYKSGFTNVDNIDISDVVIGQMVEKYKDRPGLTFTTMDVCNMDFLQASFDVIIDKGTMDCVLCGSGSTTRAEKMCSEVSRILKKDGYYLIISHSKPPNRMHYIDKKAYGWKINVDTIPKPIIKSIPQDNPHVYYFYACKKLVNEDDETEENLDEILDAEDDSEVNLESTI